MGDEGRPRRTRHEVALQPPPRVRAGGGPFTPGGTAPAPAARRTPLIAAAALIVVAVAAAAVFVMRPSPPTAVPARPVSTAPAPSTLVPAADQRTPAAADRPADRPVVARPPAVTVAPPPDAGAEAWKIAMSEGLAAVERGALDEAEASFARAEAARPGTPVVAEARKRVEEARNSEGLAVHRARAEAAEAREDWKAAAAEYEAALKIDPQVAFALAGRARTLPRAELDESLTGYLQRPERLSAEAVAREAERVLERAQAADPSGPRLQQQRAALERLLHEARTPVEVSLVSDGLTEVVVQRFGELGAFREKKVALRPGSYVVLGRRRGYRDTRKTLVVSPARVPPPLDVRCEEAL
jgi:hypothetical protein